MGQLLPGKHWDGSDVGSGNGFEEFWRGIGDWFHNTFSDAGKKWGDVWNDVSGTSSNNDFAAGQAQADRDFQWQALKDSQAFNSAEAAKARDFELMMSNTAHQRAVADMKSAGINPMMAAGSAATTPSGNAAMSTGLPSGSRAASAGSGSGGFAGLIARAAATAIAFGVANKFKNTASVAGRRGLSVSKAVEADMKNETLLHGAQKGLSAGRSSAEAYNEARKELERYFRDKRAVDEASLLARYGK